MGNADERRCSSSPWIATVALVAAGTIALEGQANAAENCCQTNADGTIHVRAFALPESSLLSEETRASLKRLRHRQKVEERVQKPCPSLEGATREQALAIRQCEAEAFYQSAVYKRFLQRYPVAITGETIGGVYTEVFKPNEAIPSRNQDRVLINVHGGHFVMGSRTQSRLDSMPIAAIGKIKVVSIDYRMAPEYSFPAASEDVAAVYRQLLKIYEPRNIGLFGCSAGGLLTAESVAWFQKEGLPLPAAIGMFGGGASYYQQGDSAYLMSAEQDYQLQPPQEHPYFKVTDAKNPLAFPIYSDEIMAKFPPSLLIATTRDIGESSVVYTHSQLVKLGIDAELHVWEGLDHCFFNAWDVPEQDQVHKVIVRFFDGHLGNSRSHTP